MMHGEAQRAVARSVGRGCPPVYQPAAHTSGRVSQQTGDNLAGSGLVPHHHPAHNRMIAQTGTHPDYDFAFAASRFLNLATSITVLSCVPFPISAVSSIALTRKVTRLPSTPITSASARTR